MQHGRELDELNQQLQNQINEHDEYEIYNQINEYDNYVSITQAPLIWDPKENKYVEVYSLEEAMKLDKLNEGIDTHEKQETKYNEYYNNLIREQDLNYLKNLITKYEK